MVIFLGNKNSGDQNFLNPFIYHRDTSYYMVLKKIGVTPFAHFALILTNTPVKNGKFAKRCTSSRKPLYIVISLWKIIFLIYLSIFYYSKMRYATVFYTFLCNLYQSISLLEMLLWFLILHLMNWRHSVLLLWPADMQYLEIANCNWYLTLYFFKNCNKIS